jgi:hypothetical protein
MALLSENRTFPGDKAFENQTIPTAVHMLCDNVLCQHDWLSSFKNIGR